MFNLPTRAAASRRKYEVGTLVKLVSVHSEFRNFAHPFRNSIGEGKKSEVWPRLSTLVTFDALRFRNEATHVKSKTNFGNILMTGIRPPKV